MSGGNVAAEHEQQQCGNCGALNPADAVVCVVCGTVLSAHKPIPATPPPPPLEKPVEPIRPTSPTQATQRGSDWRELFSSTSEFSNRPLDYLASTPSINKAETPVVPTEPSVPSKPTDRGGDWRDLFAHTPGSERRGLDFTSLPTPPVIGKTATSQGGSEQELEADLKKVQGEVVDTIPVAAAPAATRQGRRSIPAASLVPPAPDVISARSAQIDRRLGNTSPQSMILYAIVTFIGGCIGAMVLSSAGVSGVLVGLIVFAAGLAGFVMLVLGFVLAVARREGRRR